MTNTHLDELVEFPKLVIMRLMESQIIRNLLVDCNDATIEDLEDDEGRWKYFYDYEHIPGTTQEVKVAYCIDTDIVSVQNSTVKRLELYVSCFCSHALMPLDPKIFKGMSGNRLNNLLRYADLSLRGDREFGIGKLELKNVRTVSSGNAGFAKKTLTYFIPDFNSNREMLYEILP